MNWEHVPGGQDKQKDILSLFKVHSKEHNYFNNPSQDSRPSWLLEGKHQMYLQTGLENTFLESDFNDELRIRMDTQGQYE